jgi:hypothetical protein
MKQLITVLILAFSIELISIQIVNCQNTSSGIPGNIKIPVYPGASLQSENTAGEESNCCNFETKDALEKLSAFYENALKTKALDAATLATKHPGMKTQVDMMSAQMPPQMKIRFFVLQELIVEGKKGAELFELMSDPSGVHFTITESQFQSKDSHFANDWKEKMAKITETSKPAPVDPMKLATALPAIAPAGFEKGEVTSESTGQSSVNVTYTKPVKKGSGGENGSGNVYNTINVTITDESGDMGFASGMIKPEGQGEKAFKVKEKYDGKLKEEKNDHGCVGTQITFLVNSRYLVEINADRICELEVLNKFIDSMNISNLPK